MSESPALSPWTAQLLRLATRLAPKGERVWIEEMGLEYPFIDSKARLRWLLGMFGLALRLRAAGLTGSRSGRWAASLALSALFAVLVVSPVRPRPPTGLESSKTYDAAEPGLANAGVVAGVEAGLETGAARATLAPAADAQAARAAPSSLAPPPEKAAIPAAVTSEAQQGEMAQSEMLQSETAVAATADAATAESTSAENVSAAGEAVHADPIITTVASPVVVLKLTAPTQLELRRGTADGPVLQKGTFAAGRTFTVAVPFYLSTANAGGVKVQTGGEALGRLGLAGETQIRMFVRR